MTQQQKFIEIHAQVTIPRQALAGRLYLVSVDIGHNISPEQWPYDQEEFPITCVLDTYPFFELQPSYSLEGNTTVILHRFGGTYGEARFLLKAANTAQRGSVRLLLFGKNGIPLRSIELPQVEIIFEGDKLQSTGINSEAPAIRKELVLQDSDWRRLLRVIQDETCILWLGPDVVVEPQAQNDTPLCMKLAQTLADQLDREDAVSAGDDLAYIAQRYLRENDRIALELEVEDFYYNYQGRTTDLHRQLALLPISLCIDLTPAGMMTRAYEEAGKIPFRDFYGSNRGQAISRIDFTPERPLVYELFGSLDDSASLILTESDLLDFLINIAKNIPSLPSGLTSRFSDPSISFLFLGVGFQNWYLRFLLYVLKAESTHRNLSLALEDTTFFDHPDRDRMTLFYSEEHRIQFRHASWPVFAEELSQRFHLNDLMAASPAPQEDIPVVFLCHTNEDIEAVSEVRERLQQLGVNIWVDRQGLRGGDHWDRLIGKAISEWVDYVVVLETPAMLGRAEGYFYQEIRAALERARGFRPGGRFIFPAQLLPCSPLEELSHLARVDLTEPDGIEMLAVAILDEWSRRHA